jgi:pyruvate dehydrogenase E1 component alpha subunit/2-oxoisovalerate dehydrogenase E1 component alpha subunit
MERLDLFRVMLLARRFEERLAALYRQGRIVGGVYLGKGQEAISGALGLALDQETDLFAPLIRDMAGRLAFGESISNASKVYLGKADTPMRGRDGNIHRGDLSGTHGGRQLPMISHLGAMLSVLNGMLMARRWQGQPLGVGATCIGEGGMNTGALHEGLNQAAVEQLPIVVLAVDNGYAYSTPSKQSYTCRDLAERAVGYGITGYEVDARDFDACRDVTMEAVAAARAGKGPQLISARCLRLCGHGEHDDATYIPPSERESALDCVVTAQEQLANDLGTAGVQAVIDEVSATIETGVQEALSAADADPANETWQVYADATIQARLHASLAPIGYARGSDA